MCSTNDRINFLVLILANEYTYVKMAAIIIIITKERKCKIYKVHLQWRSHDTVHYNKLPIKIKNTLNIIEFKLKFYLLEHCYYSINEGINNC